MKDTLKPGLGTTRRFDIDDDKTIGFMGEALRVYATPMLLRDIEIACLEMIKQHLEEQEETVGARVELDHLGASLSGSWVDIKVEIIEVDRRKIVLDVEVHDPIELVGRARHTRFVIDRGRQADRLQAKRAKLALTGGR